MAYEFHGFFVMTPNDELASAVCRAAKANWPTVECRRISEPFLGAGVSWVADYVSQSKETVEDYDDQLGPWTHSFPELTFVRMDAVCFGGNCRYGGTVWHDGQVLWTAERHQAGDECLLDLLRYLGIESGSGYFEPFTRGYFDPRDESDLKKS